MARTRASRLNLAALARSGYCWNMRNWLPRKALKIAEHEIARISYSFDRIYKNIPKADVNRSKQRWHQYEQTQSVRHGRDDR